MAKGIPLTLLLLSAVLACVGFGLVHVAGVSCGWTTGASDTIHWTFGHFHADARALPDDFAQVVSWSSQCKDGAECLTLSGDHLTVHYGYIQKKDVLAPERTLARLHGVLSGKERGLVMLSAVQLAGLWWLLGSLGLLAAVIILIRHEPVVR